MTEAEWLAGGEWDIPQLVAALSPRRQRLLAAAACRALGRWIDHPTAHAALKVVETFADTGKTLAALRRARQALNGARDELASRRGARRLTANDGMYQALLVVEEAAREKAARAVTGTFPDALVVLKLVEGIPTEAARRQMYPLVHDVLGKPRLTLPPTWLTKSVLSLATGAYDSWDLSALPVLADALEEAGCDDAVLLAHLRGPGPHVRGCWALDLILGRE